ncbi:NEAT domain-containing protein [Paenibacillus filicis]|uniref:NEAT domain-containing protein n=1 Tax=Paenibacillus filicis TaxID=669464 RepID=A0ABU9DUE1_9BACL
MSIGIRRIVSSLMILVLVLAGLPLPSVLADSSATSRLLRSGNAEIIGGNSMGNFFLAVGNVTDSVYQQVYSYEATLRVEADKVGLTNTTAVAAWNTPVITESGSGTYKITSDVKNQSAPVKLGTAFVNLATLTLKSKPVSVTTTTTLTVTDLWLVNKEGVRWKAPDASATVTFQPTGNKQQLAALVAQVSSLNLIEGVWNGQYPVGSLGVLSNIFSTVKFSLETESSQARIDQRYNDLNTAYLAVKDKVITNNPVPVLPDGQYGIDFTIFKENSNETSVMQAYVDASSGKLTVEGGKKYVSFVLKQHAEILSLKTEKNGVLTETEIPSVDPAGNTRVVRFEIKEIDNRLNGWVKIYWNLGPPLGLYDHEYVIELGFGQIKANKEVLKTLVAEAQVEHDAAAAGALKEAVGAAIEAAQTVMNNSAATPQQVNDAVAALQKAVNALKLIVTVTSSDKEMLGGNRVFISQSIGNVTNAAYQEIYGYEATVIVDPGKLELASISGWHSQFLKPDKEELSPGVYRIKTALSSADKPVVLKSTTPEDILILRLVAKMLTEQTTATIQVKDITLINKEGGRLHVGESSEHLTIFPGGNKDQLNELIAEAGKPREGVWNGQYPVGSMAEFKKVFIESRNFVSSEQTEEAIKAQYDKLLAAYNELKLKVITDHPVPDLPDGEYGIDLTVFQNQSNEASMTNQYVVPGSHKLTVKDGKKYVSFILKQSKEIQSMKTEQNGQFTETDILSTDPIRNTRLVSFEVKDLTQRLNSWIKIYWDLGPPLGIYDHEYVIELGFGQIKANKEVLKALIAEAQAKHDAAVEGTAKGQYKTGAKAILQTGIEAAQTVVNREQLTQQEINEAATVLRAAIIVFEESVVKGGAAPVDKTELTNLIADSKTNHAAAVEGSGFGQYLTGSKAALSTALDAVALVLANEAATQAQVDEAVKKLQAAWKLFAASQYKDAVTSLPDGRYTLDVNLFLPSGDELSPIQDYVTGRGILLVKGDQKQVAFTLHSSLDIVSFQTKLNSVTAWKEASVIENNEATGKRTIQFEVQDLKLNKQQGTVKLKAAGAQEQSYPIEIGYGNIHLDLTQPVKDGQYKVNFTSRSEDPAEAPLADFIQSEGNSLNVLNGKKQAILQLQAGVNVSSIAVINAQGEVIQEITSTLAAAAFKQAGVVRVLAADPAATRVQFEVVDDLTVTYALKLTKNGQPAALKLAFGNVEPVTSYTVLTPKPEGEVAPEPPKSSTSGSSYGSGPGIPTSKLKDGAYSVAVSVLQKGKTVPSELQAYITGPVLLSVEGSKGLVTLRLKQSHKVSSFQTELNGKLTDTKVIDTNEKNDTRDVQFEIEALTSKLRIIATVDGKKLEAELTLDSAAATLLGKHARLGDVLKDKDSTSERPIASRPVLKDTASHWAEALIERAVELGLVNGYEDGSFRPDGEISRAEFIALVGRALGDGTQQSELSFADLEKIPDWAKPALAKAVQAGIVTSYEDGTFRPAQSITRSEIAVIISKAMKLPLEEGGQVTFADEQQIPVWAYASVAAAAKQGVLSGREHNVFAPYAYATRAEAVKLILSIVDNVK